MKNKISVKDFVAHTIVFALVSYAGSHIYDHHKEVRVKKRLEEDVGRHLFQRDAVVSSQVYQLPLSEKLDSFDNLDICLDFPALLAGKGQCYRFDFNKRAVYSYGYTMSDIEEIDQSYEPTGKYKIHLDGLKKFEGSFITVEKKHPGVIGFARGQMCAMLSDVFVDVAEVESSEVRDKVHSGALHGLVVAECS